MNQYQHEGTFHFIYDDYAEFKEHQPFGEFYKFYWHVGVMKPGMWTSTADGYVVELLKRTNKRNGDVLLVFPFKTIRAKRKWSSAHEGYVWTPTTKLYFNELLKKPVLVSRESKIGGMTQKELNELLALIKIGKDPLESIRHIVGKDISSKKMYEILNEISVKEPHVMEEIVSLVEKIDNAIKEKTGKTTEQVIAEKMKDLLTDEKLGPASVRENITFYLRLKYLSPREFVGAKGRSLREIPNATPPLLE